MEQNNRCEYKDSELYQKAVEISDLAHYLAQLCENQEGAKAEILADYGRQIRADALLIPAKIASAWHIDLYDLKMENAAIIRKAGRDLWVATSGLKVFGLKDEDYLSLLRETIEEFRILFAEWVKTFNPWDYVIDRWGLFNPPGVNYDDHDPDDDLPFDPPDLEDL